METSQFIACGMYAPAPGLQQAWQQLFDRFYPLCGAGPELARTLVFGADETLLRDPGLFIGHTCGYPLMTRLKDALVPFCVPVFELPGADGRLYSSRFVVPADSEIESLQQCRGGVVALNSRDSNSGMNLLRHALARRGARPGYFAEVLLTGGHRQSLEAVAANRAQLAAIDCVSLQLLGDLYPQLVAAVRVIGDSESTCGLPLVAPVGGYSRTRCDHWIAALNQALAELPVGVARTLHLERFEPVGLDDYDGILELEKFALEAGYGELN